MIKYFGSKAAFTLTEIAIVLGLIGLILSGIWSSASSVYKNNKVSTAMREMTIIVGNMRSLYQNNSFSAPPSVQLLATPIAAGVYPTDMALITSGPYTGHPENAFGTWSTIWALDTNIFRVSFYNLTIDECVNLVSLALGSKNGTNLVGVGSWYPSTCTYYSYISSGTNQYTCGTTSGDATLLTPTTAASMCGGGNAANSGALSAEFDFTFTLPYT